MMNQPMEQAVHPSPWLSAREATARLGVKLETLYAYVSRGLVRSVPGEGRRAQRYAREDLDRLRARRDARAGHGAVAAGALAFGEPVLDTALVRIEPEGPRYRGRLAVELARGGVSFERVAELLWTGALPDEAPAASGSYAPLARLRAQIPAGASAAMASTLLLASLALADPSRFGARHDAELARARRLLRTLAAAAALPFAPERARSAFEAGGIARGLAHALGARRPAQAARALDRALVLSADHELNPSSFAARVAASAGADLYACLAAASATLSGPRHGGACDRVEALIADVGAPSRARAAIEARLRRGEAIAGFGHPLYPAGDPRAALLLDDARALLEASPRARDGRAVTLLAIVRAMRDAGHEPPTLDVGLVAIATALGLPEGAALAIFGVGRAAGWVAHALEQRASPTPLRPRARYVGA
jgi:citrate synthase